ncbi:universal stress protein [Streptomyces turgidiscabies]|uniref:Universal stress family protein n=1 Tax=Streptomyces turgidiscabies (strain Car8) TaxID=698760 RepID=L7FEN7_STRT8|nr:MULTISPECIES: universal stress protein [Streptomyces]ELP69120.1 universal stress family protein [Streptomyces turgidiscabies Car8]MDX3495250.1 universal stress protein [Streptomyces turgidiscabies]GAQ71128.1 universal stress protein/MT2052 [Streptomyces turgidiscabies]
MTTRHVVVGVDGSVVAVRALDLAADEAALRATTLEIVYAVPDLDEAWPELASAASRVAYRHPGLPVVTVPVGGHPAAVLAERGREAALTVVGHRSPGELAGTVLDSVSRSLAAHAHGPLLVIRGDSPPHLHNEVLLVLDADADADTAAYAIHEAGLRGAGLRILRPPAYRRPASAPVQPRRSEAAAAHVVPAGDVLVGQGERYPRVQRETQDAGPASTQALLEATRTSDLVVIGCRSGSGGHGRHLGSGTRMLLNRAHCPVLVVTAGQESTRPSPT